MLIRSGYNFDILESTQSFIHNLAENMGVNVESAWATPAKSYTVTTFKFVATHNYRSEWKLNLNYREGGVVAKDSYSLNLYERNVQVAGLRSIDAPILIDTIRTGQQNIS